MKGEQIMRNVTLKVNGRKMTFSEKEISSILEEHFSRQKPTEGEWFEVKPQDINQKLFRRKRKMKSKKESGRLLLKRS